MKLLLVEDDLDLAKSLKRGLEAESFVIDHASDGEEGSFLARTGEYDIAILDYSLPKKSGLEICKELRSAGKSYSVIFLSVRNEISKKIEALDKGADDFIVKPFSYQELISRIRAILRRPKNMIFTKIILGNVTLDTKTQEISVNDKKIYLTKKEYNLFEFFMKNPETVLSRTTILDQVWNSELDSFSNTVESHILNLRKKICTKKTGLAIKNVPGRGYLLGETNKKFIKP